MTESDRNPRDGELVAGDMPVLSSSSAGIDPAQQSRESRRNHADDARPLGVDEPDVVRKAAANLQVIVPEADVTDPADIAG